MDCNIDILTQIPDKVARIAFLLAENFIFFDIKKTLKKSKNPFQKAFSYKQFSIHLRLLNKAKFLLSIKEMTTLEIFE